ncbi:hypothetical protein [Longitalea arenae]|uniref:hypothetical protein n=1 Tax=Longitalea arenae TaxID=2812558 RepID=UPI0019684F5C|nr:hypothetical protein [Longitalea arenae]
MKAFMKPLLYLIVAFVIFSLFIYALLRPSTSTKASKEIERCVTPSDVRTVWEKYHLELAEDEDYNQAVRDKLGTFNLKQSEIKEIKNWLPAKTHNLNIILVPDLSNRINDDKNNPEQTKNDTALLNSIWAVFEKNYGTK